MSVDKKIIPNIIHIEKITLIKEVSVPKKTKDPIKVIAGAKASKDVATPASDFSKDLK